MKWSTWQSRHRVLLGTATSAAAVALIAVGVPAAALATHPASHARPAQVGPGYPPPGGIYSQFTNCPLLNPIMQETPPGPGYPGTSLNYCVNGAATSGSITIGTITTPVVRPVNVQFGVWTPVNATNGGDNPGGSAAFAGGILPPIAGIGALLSTKPDLIPGSLTTVLGCATTTDKVVKNICTQAEHYGGKYLDVYALAKNVGQLTNFGLTTWTQRVNFQLRNPLLGSNCYIGSANNPVVLNPSLSLGPGGSVALYNDPNPVKHPDTEVLNLYGAIASDTTFTAPGVTGCGPGGDSQRLGQRGARRRHRPARGVWRQQPHTQRRVLRRCQLPCGRHVADPAAEQQQEPAVRVQGQRRGSPGPRAPGRRSPDLRPHLRRRAAPPAAPASRCPQPVTAASNPTTVNRGSTSPAGAPSSISGAGQAHG